MTGVNNTTLVAIFSCNYLNRVFHCYKDRICHAYVHYFFHICTYVEKKQPAVLDFKRIQKHNWINRLRSFTLASQSRIGDVNACPICFAFESRLLLNINAELLPSDNQPTHHSVWMINCGWEAFFISYASLSFLLLKAYYRIPR